MNNGHACKAEFHCIPFACMRGPFDEETELRLVMGVRAAWFYIPFEAQVFDDRAGPVSSDVPASMTAKQPYTDSADGRRW